MAAPTEEQKKNFAPHILESSISVWRCKIWGSKLERGSAKFTSQAQWKMCVIERVRRVRRKGGMLRLGFERSMNRAVSFSEEAISGGKFRERSDCSRRSV